MIDKEEMSRLVVNHLIEIMDGNCSITSDEISRYSKLDASYAEMLTSLNQLHEGLVFKDKKKAEIEKELSTEIEELKKKNRELNLAKKDALSAKSEFLSNMSHEIRTPMNGVIGMTNIMLRHDLDEDQKRRALIIKSSASSLLQIINDILDLSKVEAGKMDLEEIRFEMGQLIEDCMNTVKFNASEKDLYLSFPDQEACSEAYLGDPGRLRQVIINLVNNAIKFTEEGSISFTYKVIESSGVLEKIRFEIEDTGIGISEKRKNKLFERFTQAEESTTRRYGGTGLGLTICKKLTMLMQGEIGVETELGVGSTFWFTVELKKPKLEIINEDQTDKLHEYDKEERFSAKVLLAEDNITNQLVARVLLEGLGVEIEIVNNGEEAVKAYKTTDFDFVLMDCEMPVMDGCEATEQIRDYEAGESKAVTPIIAMTAHVEKEEKEKCYLAGMNDHIGKPVTVEVLSVMLKKWLTTEATVKK